MTTPSPSNSLIPNEPIKGRGAITNPAGRFESTELALDLDTDWPEELERPRTRFFKDHAQSIISTHTSPDISIKAFINPYRGCEHGCIYCYARPSHEYLGLSAGLDFETKIFVKERAPKLLANELSQKSWVPQVVGLSGITDPYQPVEKKLGLTRQCLQVLVNHRNPVAIISKNALVTRDIDLLQELAQFNAIHVSVSLTTLDGQLARTMEPRTADPERRLTVLSQLSKAGIPAGIVMGPIIPGLTDHEIPAVLNAAKQAGAISAFYTVVRLPYGVKALFEEWVTAHFPNRAGKILNRIRHMRGGQLYQSNFGTRMKGEGLFAEAIGNTFALFKSKYGLNGSYHSLSTQHFCRTPEAQQTRLF